MIDKQEVPEGIGTENGAAAMAAGTGLCPVCGGGPGGELMVAPDRFHLRRELYRLMRCPECSYVWLQDPPKPEQMAIHYDADYHKAIMAAGEGQAFVRWKGQRDVISKFKKGGAILDVGCSSGAFLSTMKGPSWKLHGIELEPSTAEKARQNTGAEVFVGDAMDAPFPPESFDVVTTFDVLEHVYQPREFLAKVWELLKPNGIYYVMLPNIDSWESRAFGSYWFGLELPRHLSHFSPRSLRRVTHSLGFEELLVSTSSATYVERSTNYVWSGLVEKAGGTPTPQSKAAMPGIPWRVLRKGWRLSVVAPFGHVASWAGAGASLEGVFIKPAAPPR